MKYVLFFTSIFLIVAAGCVSVGGRESPQALSSQDIYEGSAEGYRGRIHVQVRMNAGSIREIIVLDSMEDRFVGGAAIEELIDTVMEYNSTDVDVVTGATVTSKGFLEAVKGAIIGL